MSEREEQESTMEKVTFPMRPEKKRLLVRKSHDPTKSSPANASDQGKQSPKRRVFVSKTIDARVLEVDQVGGENGVVYKSPFGKLSPAKQGGNNNEKRSEERRDSRGNVVPYSILGNAQDFEKFSGSRQDQAKSPSRLSRPSSRRSSAALLRMRSSRSQLLTPNEEAKEGTSSTPSLKSVDTMDVSSAAASSAEVHDALATQTPEEYLEQVRELARKETVERQELARKKEEADRKERLAGMLAHERLMYDRQERALKLYEDWQYEWAKFKETMCAVSNKKPEDLVFSRAGEYRERTEEYNFINAATPHHEKHGSEYWMMSLRGMGTRYVAVGNIFSGLFCPVREESNTEVETIRVPSNLSPVGSHGRTQHHQKGKKPSWRDSPILRKRTRQLAQYLEQIRPHQVSHDDAANLVIKGEPLFEWAYVSTEKYNLELQEMEARAALENGEVPRSAEVEDETKQLADFPSLGRPKFYLDCVSENDASNVETTGSVINIDAQVGHTQSGYAMIHNMGTTALYFSWKQTKTEDNENEGKFFCSEIDGVILPSESRKVVFSFKSDLAGSFSSTWEISTKPNVVIPEENKRITIRGISFAVDDSKPSREALKQELQEQARLREIERAEALAKANAPPPPPPEPSMEEKRARFEFSNRALGLFYHPELEREFTNLAREVFEQVHAFDMVLKDGQIESAVQSDLNHWIASPSLVRLRGIIRDIGEGGPLFPKCRAETLASVESGSEVSEDEDDEEEEEEEEEQNAASQRGSEDVNEGDEEESPNKENGEFEEEDGEEEGDLEDENMDYIAKEKARLKLIATGFDEVLMALARKTLRKPENSSPFWNIAHSCIIDMVDAIVDVVDVPAKSEEELEAERLEAEALAKKQKKGKKDQPPGDAEAGVPVERTQIELACDAAMKVIEAFAQAAESIEQTERAKILKSANPIQFQNKLMYCSKVEDLGQAIRGKRILVQVDVNIPNDSGELDEQISAMKLGKVATTIDMIAAAGPKSILLVGHRASSCEPAEGSSLQSVSEELANRLGREVIFFENVDEEETLNTLIEPEEDDEDGEDDEDEEEEAKDKGKKPAPGKAADSKKKQDAAPAMVDADDIPVFMLENLNILIPKYIPQIEVIPTVGDTEDEEEEEEEEEEDEDVAMEETGKSIRFVDDEKRIQSKRNALGLLKRFAEVLVFDSVDGIVDQVEFETIPINGMSQTVFIGPTFETQFDELYNVLEKDHIVVIGGEHLPYPGGSQDEEGEEDEEEEEYEEAEGPEAGEQEDGEEGEEPENTQEQEEAKTATEESVSVQEDWSKYTSYGFYRQLQTIKGLIRTKLASSFLVTGKLANAFRTAILEMGKVADRLATNNHDVDSFDFPCNEADVRNKFDCTTYKAYENEMMREIFELARQAKVTIHLLEEGSQLEMRLQIRKWIGNVLGSTVILMNGLDSDYGTRFLLRELGARLKQQEQNQLRKVSLHSSFVLKQVDFLRNGNADDEIELEIEEDKEYERKLLGKGEEDEEDEEEDEEEEDELEQQKLEEEQKKNANRKPIGKKDEPVVQEEPEEDTDPFGLQHFQYFLNLKPLETVLDGVAMSKLEDIAKICDKQLLRQHLEQEKQQ